MKLTSGSRRDPLEYKEEDNLLAQLEDEDVASVLALIDDMEAAGTGSAREASESGVASGSEGVTASGALAGDEGAVGASEDSQDASVSAALNASAGAQGVSSASGTSRTTGSLPWSSEYGNPDKDFVIESDLVVPKIMLDEQEKPLIVCVDDDFDTLDLLKVYLQRDYEYMSFSGPREAIFSLNQKVPTLIMIDCKIHTMRATTFIDIARTGEGKENIKFVYTGTKEELAEIDTEGLPEHIIGTLEVPVSRANLQRILDML